VTDTGIGMSPDQQTQLFMPFTQAETHTSRKYGGTGLGLSISQSIIKMMDGDIEVKSEIGKGSTFSFTVNIKRKELDKRKTGGMEQSWNNIRVLAADGDSYILNDLKGILEGLGISCDTAGSEEDAIALVEQNGAYHLYFIDWKMPGSSGIELSNKLLQKFPEHDSSLVFMISFAEYILVSEEAQKTDLHRFMQKPLFPTTIAETIGKCLGAAEQDTAETEAVIDGIFEGRRILLAEDVEINREIVLALFEPTMLAIDCASNGVEAVRMFIEAPDKYELIFMDLQMPEMDGYDATRHIRALGISNAKTIPIIAMTANVFKEDVNQCLEAGMDGHVGKPLDFDEVLGILKQYLIKVNGKPF